MKRIISMLFLTVFVPSVLITATFTTGCNFDSNQTTPAPVETPLAEPTEEPNPIQAARPTFDNSIDLGIAAEFPTFAPLGKLIDRSLMPEGAKYFVLYGESNLRYVYDENCELVTVFRGQPDYGYPMYSFYGEHGICSGFSFELMDYIKDYSHMGELWMKLNSEGRVVEILDLDFKSMLAFDNGGINIGNAGGILCFGDNYIVFDRTYDIETRKMTYNRPLTILNADGKEIDTIDPEKFGNIQGIFAGEYIIAAPDSGALELPFLYEATSNIYSIDGELIKDNVSPMFNGVVAMNKNIIAQPYSVKYYFDDERNLYDETFKKVSNEAEAMQDYYQCIRKYECLQYDGNSNLHLEYSGIYAGLKVGNRWVFKIYNPRLASDSRNGLW